jgi:hypothetical protein
MDRKRKTVNAYAAELLHREPFEESWAKAVIWKADRSGRIDHRIFNPAELVDV